MADPIVAPPPFKLTWFITHTNTNTGWSETYYVNAATDVLANATGVLLAPLRMALLTNKYRMVYGRVSRLDVKGDGYPLAITFPAVGTFAPAAPDGNHPGNGVVYRWSDGAGLRAMRFLHGVPEECITDGDFAPTAPYITALSAWHGSLITNTLMRKKIAVAPFASFVPVNAINHRYASVKKVGKPFGLRRGRAALRT